MAAGDTLRRITLQDQIILDVDGNVVGLKNPNANGSDFRPVAQSVTWANKPTTANLNDRIRITDFGIPSLLMIWDGARWVPDGMQLLARSAVAVSITGTAAETALATVTIPTGLMGINGGFEVRSVWSVTNSANNKSLRVRLGGIGGTPVFSAGTTAIVSYSDQRRVRNRNSASSQVVSMNAGAFPYGSSTSALATAAIDTSVAQDLVFTGQLTNTGETITLESYDVLVSA